MNSSKQGSEQRRRKLKDQKQRKQALTTSPSNEYQSQKTISELLCVSKNSSPTCESRTFLESSSNKRVKYSHSFTSSDQIEIYPKTVQPDDMYNLPSMTSIGNNYGDPRSGPTEIIEISDSPPGSPISPLCIQRKPSAPMKATRLQSYTGPKKLVVRNFKKTPVTDPNQYFDQVWQQLHAALQAIFRSEKIPHSKEELYRNVENVCRQDRALLLFKKLCEECEHELSSRLKDSLVNPAVVMKDTDVLCAVIEAWSVWISQLATIRSIFFYLDRSYLLKSTSESIETMGIGEFCSHIFSNPILKPRIIKGACDLVKWNRQEQEFLSSDHSIQRAIDMFYTLEVYSKDFEPKLLSESQCFFLNWAQEKSSSCSLAEYVKECHYLISHEIQRFDTFNFDSSTKDWLITYLDDILIQQKQNMLLEVEDVSILMEQNEVNALKQLYSLMQRKSLGEKLRAPFEAFIIKQGSSIVFDEKREHEMVFRLLDFKKKLDYLWEHAFEMHEVLGHALRESFETFINMNKRSTMTWGTDNPKPGEMIAKYVDTILKGGHRAVLTNLSLKTEPRETSVENLDGSSEDEDTELEKKLDQVLDLFRFVHGKAVFEAFYKRDLARRLLLGRSASSDAEKSMLTRLKSECGAGFTHNLEQMFKDIELAREEITSYKSMLEESQLKTPLDLNVHILSASAWPSYPDVALEIPKDVQSAISGFQSYYKLKHSGRRLTWKHALSHCQLKAKFPKGNKEIVVSAFQAIVLLLLDEKPSGKRVSYAEIQAASNLYDEDLKRTLQSLACAKYQVLIKFPRGKEVNNTDSFTINLSFSDPKFRIKINQVQAKETKEENKETHERVAADRNYETQAAIVRIMKTRKTITHAELVSEVLVATKSRGALDPVDIKKNIEKLIEKDYMERENSEAGRNTYNYLA